MAVTAPVQLNRKQKDLFIDYYNHIQNKDNDARSEVRSAFERIDKLYQRETDKDYEHLASKNLNKLGDSQRFQNITVPIIKPQVEAAVRYQAATFLTNVPIFGVSAAPDFIDPATQLETVIDHQSIKGGWIRDLILFFRDGAKFNFSAIEVPWTKRVSYTVDTDIEQADGINSKKVIWRGNDIVRLDPYNTFLDRSVAPAEVYLKGDFSGYTEYVNKSTLKLLIDSLDSPIVSSIRPALESTAGASFLVSADSRDFFIPDIAPDVTARNYPKLGTNWFTWAGLEKGRDGRARINYKDGYQLTHLYCRIMPDDFGIIASSSKTPQIYKLLIVNHQHIISCERQTNAHNMIPILIGQPEEDGLGYQTKSLAQDGEPFQDLTSAYMNSIIHSRRRLINDRALYDPSRVKKEHINSDNPTAKIPVRPTAYNKTVSDAVYAFPYRNDHDSSAMQQVQALIGLSNLLSGQNAASQGQFVKGNKLESEWQDIMSNASGRDRLSALLYEAQVFQPLKQILLYNTLQYQGAETLYSRAKEESIEIDPVVMRKAVMEFKVSDGLIPKEQQINSDAFGMALQVIGSSPQISSEYQLGDFISYLFKTQGADISVFQKSSEQLAYEQALQQWQQLAVLAMEKDKEFNRPQPKPADYGYTPGSQSPEASNEL